MDTAGLELIETQLSLPLTARIKAMENHARILHLLNKCASLSTCFQDLWRSSEIMNMKSLVQSTTQSQRWQY